MCQQQLSAVPVAEITIPSSPSSSGQHVKPGEKKDLPRLCLTNDIPNTGKEKDCMSHQNKLWLHDFTQLVSSSSNVSRPFQRNSS